MYTLCIDTLLCQGIAVSWDGPKELWEFSEAWLDRAWQESGPKKINRKTLIDWRIDISEWGRMHIRHSLSSFDNWREGPGVGLKVFPPKKDWK